MQKLLLLVSVLFFVGWANAQTQTKDELQKKEADLRKEISDLANSLVQIQKNKKSTVAQVAAVQRKIAAREELIGNINRQVRLLDETIYLNELEIYRLKKELDTLKSKYAQSIVFAYKNRSNYQYLNFLFSASNFNDAVKRVTYLKSYRKLRETQVSTIQKTQEVLQQKIGTLSTSKKEQSLVLQTQQVQLKDLEADKKQKDVVVKELKGKEKEVSALIRKKEKLRQDMKVAINAIIKREIALARAEEERKAKLERERIAAEAKKNAGKPADVTAKVTTTPKVASTTNRNSNEPLTGMNTAGAATREYSPLESTPEGVEISISFEKRNLPWPTNIGTVIIPFGPYKVSDKLVGQSDGIEIAVPEGTTVKSVADGEVSGVYDIGGELVVTLKHGKYFTTFSHLGSISVSKGQKVKAGTELGKSGLNNDGDGSLLFMITNDKGTNLNPKSWLRSR
jgi:septal ring factor EnvC (AmiA/AmiB activator)